MFERRITREEVREALRRGEVIEHYPEDQPFPSCLLLALVSGRALHVVLAQETETGTGVVLTVYEPDAAVWKEGFRARRRV
jgi:hypothetical protein